MCVVGILTNKYKHQLCKVIQVYEFRGGSHMKGAGMLVLLRVRGVNFEFWSHLGCSGQNPISFSRNGPF